MFLFIFIGIWRLYKEFFVMVEWVVLYKKILEVFYELEVVLDKFNLDFIILFKNLVC